MYLGYDDSELAIQFQRTGHSPKLLHVTSGVNKMSSVFEYAGKAEVYERLLAFGDYDRGDGVDYQVYLDATISSER